MSTCRQIKTLEEFDDVPEDGPWGTHATTAKSSSGHRLVADGSETIITIDCPHGPSRLQFSAHLHSVALARDAKNTLLVSDISLLNKVKLLSFMY
ncbi:hypothetical protein GWI33_002330 [Rhynchophorus ferrugineus]|uniref:Uncharacterized protein n=1 Tax=Rhynchophorus ferrugineus TaxID=354439 RepID=A0A834MFT5_RHYFE|nr:hypothetical protein GWI33_002330 [Rhynchophorus ferrugineus]